MYPIREILRLFVLPKGRCFAGRCFAGRWARAFHKCVGGGGNNLPHHCWLSRFQWGQCFVSLLTRTGIGRCFWEKVLSETDAPLFRHAKTLLHPSTHDMAVPPLKQSKAHHGWQLWILVLSFFVFPNRWIRTTISSGCWLKGQRTAAKTTDVPLLAPIAPRKTCYIGSPSAKTVCASTSAWGMAFVSWGPDIICNDCSTWIQ